jgi:vitamin B12 transporter
MRKNIFLLPVAVLSLLIALPAIAAEVKNKQSSVNQEPQSIIPNSLSEFPLPATQAKLLTEVTTSKNVGQESTGEKVSNNTNQDSNDGDIILNVVGEKDTLPQSTPTYIIEKEEIKKQGARSAAEVLKGLPGFAINDAGFAADIHTGTYYRGQSINQSVFLLNGRPIGSNINTYHGNTDLNTIPVESIERVEFYSGTASTLYGSQAFGGIVNIITKQGQEKPKVNAEIQYGSYGQANYRASYGGTTGKTKFNLSFEDSKADNNYPVPVGAANRGPDGRLFNGDVATTNYVGSVSHDIDQNNTVSLNAYKISSRKGLIYFGFPLQKDRLDHDTLNIALGWKTNLGGNKDSVLNTTIAFNQDYFNTYGPSGNFNRTGTLDSKALSARVEHQWQVDKKHFLRWGLDAKNNQLDGNTLSTLPTRVQFNGTQNKDRLEAALFALDTWQLSDKVQLDLGLRQNLDSEFGNYLNPSFGVNYAYNPDINVRGSWASVQRNPGLDQLYVYDTVHGWAPNPDLKPETGSSWTAGVDAKLARNLNGQLTLFGSSLDNRLSVASGKWANVGLVNTNGLEAGVRWQFAPQWSSFLNYTYTDARIESGAEKGRQLALIPYSVAQMGVGYEQNGWEVNLIASYNGGTRRAFFNNGTTATDFSPSWLNLDLGAKVPIAKNVGLTFFLENLADVSYEKVNRIYQPGLTYRIGITSTF